jgi:uncharacterized protein (TIGR02246 family)
MQVCRLLFLLLAVGANSFSPAQQPSRDVEAIARIRTEWTIDLHSKQLDQIVMLYAPDAVFLPPSGERIAGRAAIRELTGNVMAKLTSNISLHSMVTEHSGNLAYDSGEYSETVVKTADGSKTDLQGSYLMVFKRQADGKWLIALQMWTETSPGHSHN